MRTYFLILLAFLVQAILASDLYPHSSTFYGCPDECSTERNPKCEHGLPSNRFFVALHKNYFKSKPYKYCDHYWVGLILDDKADGKYKMVRAKVVDQCGSCAETQVDLSQELFESIAHKRTGVVDMVYVILNKDTNEIIDGPHYNSSVLKNFANKHGVSRDTIMESFKEAAKNLNKQGGKGMNKFPWESGSFDKDSKKEEKSSKKTTTTTTKKAKEQHTKKTTVEVIKIKTAHVKPVTKSETKSQPKPSVIEAVEPKPIETFIPKPDSFKPKQEEEEEVIEVEPIEGEEIEVEGAPVLPKPIDRVIPKGPNKNEKPANDELDEFDKYNGGTNAPVAAGVIGVGVIGAAGIGLIMLKRKSPQKYDDLKQKFPEAFSNVKRSISRGASNIKRGVSRRVNRRNMTRTHTPLPASYSFTLNTEDGLPRVALYDDPYPTQTNGAQHW